MSRLEHLMEAEKQSWRLYSEVCTRVRLAPRPSNEDWLQLERRQKEWNRVHDALQYLMGEAE